LTVALLSGCVRQGLDLRSAPPDATLEASAAPDAALLVHDLPRLDLAPDLALPDSRPPDTAPPPLAGPGKWTITSSAPIPPRVWTTGVWTGAEVIVFGGALDTSYNPTDTGARYDPKTGAWTATSQVGAPAKRHTALLIWTGKEMIVFAGGSGWGALNSSGGGRYDPATDTWAAMTTQGSPGPRIYGRAVWTGSQMLVWGGWTNGGGHLQTGGRYDPAQDKWAPITTVGAPSARSLRASSCDWTHNSAIMPLTRWKRLRTRR